jgi:hypothetical protein
MPAASGSRSGALSKVTTATAATRVHRMGRCARSHTPCAAGVRLKALRIKVNDATGPPTAGRARVHTLAPSQWAKIQVRARGTAWTPGSVHHAPR